MEKLSTTKTVICRKCGKDIKGVPHILMDSQTGETTYFCSELDHLNRYKPYITNPVHGGKVTCHKCNGFIKEGDGEGFLDHQHRNDFPNVWFHKSCFNQYEHYYGLDKPLD